MLKHLTFRLAEFVDSFSNVDKSKIDAIVICVGTAAHDGLIREAANSGMFLSRVILLRCYEINFLGM